MTMRVVLVLALVAGVAFADDREQAAAHFKQGQAFYKAGDYDHAIHEYEAAYSLSQEPLLLFNIALCNDKAQRPEKALEGFQRYLSLAPDGDVADEAREDVARLTPIVDEIRAKRAAEDAERTAAAARAKQAEDVVLRKQAAERAERARRAEAERAELARPVARRAQVERWVAYGVVGLGAVAAGVSIYEGVVARDDSNAVAGHTSGAWTDSLLAKEAAGKTANSRMVGFAIAAGALAAGGGILLWLAHRDERHAAEIRVAPLPGGAAVALTARF